MSVTVRKYLASKTQLIRIARTELSSNQTQKERCKSRVVIDLGTRGAKCEI